MSDIYLLFKIENVLTGVQLAVQTLLPFSFPLSFSCFWPQQFVDIIGKVPLYITFMYEN